MSQPSPVVMSDETKKLLIQPGTLPTEITVQGSKYYPKGYVAAGFKGVVFRGVDDYDGAVAIKLTVYEDYMDKSYLEEAAMARRIGERPPFASFRDAGLLEVVMPDGSKQTFVCFVEGWVDGSTLVDYLAQQEVDPPFFLGYVRGMCAALNILKTEELRHDDLRPANVMISPPKPGDMPPATSRITVIDTGSLKKADTPTKKEMDDYSWFARHLVDIWNAIHSRKALTLVERRFLHEAHQLLKTMLEEDRSVALWEPTKVSARFQSAWTRALHPEVDGSTSLHDPFDYIAAEHIASNKLLVSLFADSCPWYRDVAGPDPLLLTGPRGCGKSMVFRRLSLLALLFTEPKEIEESGIAGFYISCSADLRNRLAWLSTETMAHRFKREVVHYFNLLLVREVVRTLAAIGRREDRESLFGYGQAAEVAVHEFLMERLAIDAPSRRYLQGSAPAEHAIWVTESELRACYARMLRGETSPTLSDASFVADFTQLLADSIGYFHERKIVFLVDDFSVHRVPAEVQRILASVIWDRQASHVFKLSSEKFGAEVVDELKATAESTRELREIDAGRSYLALRDKASRRFAEDLLAIRLKAADYKGTPEELLGRSQYEEGSLGKALRARAKAKGRSNDQYHGLETVADICSGDVSVLLEVYRRIFADGKVGKHTTAQVPKHVQHAAIQSVSHELLNLIKDYVPMGQEMHTAIYWFGRLSRRIVREGCLQLKAGDAIPNETSRIEVDQPPSVAAEKWTPEQVELMKQLVRRCIFIEMEPGRSRHGFTLSLRWQLRRVYCPAFGTTLAKNVAVKWTPEEFKWFITNPKSTCETEFNKRWKQGGGAQSVQGNLPGMPD